MRNMKQDHSIKIFNMNQKVLGGVQQAIKIKDSKSQKFLRATISPKLSSKHSMHKKSVKREKSEKKVSQMKSKKQIQLLFNYFDQDEHLEGQLGNHEYYNNQVSEKMCKKGSRKEKDCTDFSKSKQTSFQTDLIPKNSSQLKRMDSGSSLQRIKLPQVKGVINFDGKYVKTAAEDPAKKANHYITDSNSNYTDLCYGERQREGKMRKKRRRQKSQNKTNEKKIKSKSKSKNQEMKKKLSDMRNSLDNESAVLLKKYRFKEKQDGGDTEPSPGQQTAYQRTEVIDYENVQKEIAEQRSRLRKINIPKSCFGERIKCINMMSRICGDMQFRTEALALSIRLLDQYLNEQIVGTKMKIIGLSALILALKIEEAQTAAAFQFQIMTASTSTYTRQLRSSIPIRDKSEERPISKKKSKKEEITNKVGSRKNIDDLYSRVTLLSKILRQQFGNQIIPKSQLIQYQSLITMKLGFRLQFKTYAYWVDLLTVIWDQKILNFHQESQKLLFRCPKYRINMSYLLQILQIVYYDPQITLVLSVMYLLIRITMQQEPQGYDKYRRTLEKSSNPLFIDTVGCNKLFGEFLQILSLEMGEILQCCQYVSHFLCPTLLRNHRLQGWVYCHQPYDQILFLHSHNPHLLRYIQH